MENPQFNRRKFIEKAATATGFGLLGILPQDLIGSTNKEITPSPEVINLTSKKVKERIRFSVIGLNHGHIYGQTDAVIRGGGQLTSFYAKEDDLASSFAKKYPQAKRVKSEKEILEDKAIQLVVSASIPNERAPLGIRVMEHDKDFMADKPGITSLDQLEDVRRVQKKTGKIYSIMYSERFENRATVKAGELVKAGAIGKVIQTVGLGPHKMNIDSRPEWFFDRKFFGGIITDIGSHQFDQFLYFTNTSKAEIVSSQVGNINNPKYPEFEDFGDTTVTGDGGTGYIRVDWFTPQGLDSWGDGRLTILGTNGYIEIRKNIDISGRKGGNHLFLVNQEKTQYIDCSQVPLPYGEQFVDDILNRTETAMTQEHCFLATELALKAQKEAKIIHF